MKIIRVLGCTWLTLMGAIPLVQGNMIRVSEMDETLIQQFTHGQLHDLTIECPEGTALPFYVDVRGDFFNATSGSIPFAILKTLYIRCEQKEEFLFSTDQKEWKTFSDFFKGKLNVSVRAEQGMVRAGMELELNAR